MFEGASFQSSRFFIFFRRQERIAKILEALGRTLQTDCKDSPLFPLFAKVELHTFNRSGMVQFSLSNVSSTVLFIIAQSYLVDECCDFIGEGGEGGGNVLFLQCAIYRGKVG